MKIDKKILKQIAIKAKAKMAKNSFSKNAADELAGDEQLFKNKMSDITPFSQDKVLMFKRNSTTKFSQSNSKQTNISTAEFHFSDQYEPQLPTQGAMKYVRADVSSFESKALRRGDYVPELILDLHGLNQQQAKRELAALLVESKKQHINCVCIVHGIGSRVLKNKMPHYLVQHPDVMAFHQATLEWGGDGALLVLLEVEDR